MNRTAIVNENNILKNGDYVIDGLLLSEKDVYIETEVKTSCDILLNNIKDIKALKIVINPDSNARLSFIAEKAVKNTNIQVAVKNNASISGYFADFSEDVLNLNCQISLVEEGATCDFKVASLTANKDHKVIDVSLEHATKKTYGKFECFGICKDEGKILVAGVSHIANGAIKSKTQQNCKIMVFDEASNAIAKPVLKIDENDLEASHSAVVGKINDEHLFYLKSRGLSEENAKELITMGYLKPILLGFKEDEIKEHISSLIERRM